MPNTFTVAAPLRAAAPGARPPRVGLFIPCYIDQLYPQVGLATVAILHACGADVHFPEAQTCCGQPMANTGCTAEARPLAEKFLRVFAPYDYVVAPSGSCVAMVRFHYEEYLHGRPGFPALKRKTFELCEFLTDVLQVRRIGGRFPHRVGLHQSCHGLRELRLGTGSERAVAYRDPARALLGSLDGIALVEPARRDECCGFGGTFAVTESAVSGMMGRDRVRAYVEAGAEYITATDVSCLAHLDGVARRTGVPVRVAHVAEILAEAGE